MSPWPQFRGPSGNGVAAPEAILPHHWTTERGIRWRTLLPDGISQPLVSDDRVIVTGARNHKSKEPSRLVLSLDAASGQVVWETEILTAAKEKHHWISSLAVATPAMDSEAIYAYFGPTLASLNHDGEVRWNETIDPDYWQQSRYGAASSPVLADGKVIILRDMEYGEDSYTEQGWVSWLAAYSQVDGSRIWRTEWTNTCCSYATPTLAERDGTLQILVTSSPLIKSFDLETGAELWAVDYPSVQVVPSSSIAGDLFIASGAVHDRLTAGFRLSGSGTETGIQELWSANRMVPGIASPVLYEGTLYQVTEKGVVSALDAETGSKLKHWRLPAGPYRASMIAGDGKIFALSDRGTVSVWRPSPSFEMLGTNPLPADTGSYLSMAAGIDCLLLRSREALYCVDGFEPEPAAESPEDDLGH